MNPTLPNQRFASTRSCVKLPSVDRPIDKTDETGTADDVAEGYRDEIVDDPGYGDHRRVETVGRLAGHGQQPSQGQEIHVGDAVLESGRYERGDRQNQPHDLIRDRATRIGDPD